MAVETIAGVGACYRQPRRYSQVDQRSQVEKQPSHMTPPETDFTKLSHKPSENKRLIYSRTVVIIVNKPENYPDFKYFLKNGNGIINGLRVLR